MTATTTTTRDQALTLARQAGVSEKQFNFLERLVRERVDDFWPARPDERVSHLYGLFRRGELDGHKTSREITYWLTRPHAPVTEVRVERDALVPGVYELDGRIYVVRKNRVGDRLYAKRLSERNGSERIRVVDGREFVDFELTYAPGVAQNLSVEHRVPRERARELALRYGRCVYCGRVLRDPSRGVGPVCVKSFGPIVENAS